MVVPPRTPGVSAMISYRRSFNTGHAQPCEGLKERSASSTTDAPPAMVQSHKHPARRGDFPGVQRGDEVVQFRRHSATDTDEERGWFHFLKARAVEEALGRRRVRTVRITKSARGTTRPARPACAVPPRPPVPMSAGHPSPARHPERRQQPGRLRADAADADDQRRRLRQMHHVAGFLAGLLPLRRACCGMNTCSPRAKASTNPMISRRCDR